jgi:hypothetical protein
MINGGVLVGPAEADAAAAPRRSMDEPGPGAGRWFAKMRFLRPVCYQGLSDPPPPPTLLAANPRRLVRRHGAAREQA